MLRLAGSASKPNSRSGDDRWKKLSAFDWTIWARFITRRRSAPVGGGSTARISSQALDEAIRWLTGQMPQMRAMIDGISWNGRPWQIRSKPRNCVTWNWASCDLAGVVEVDRDLRVALDPGDRVDDDLAGSWSLRPLSGRTGRRVGVRARRPSRDPIEQPRR